MRHGGCRGAAGSAGVARTGDDFLGKCLAGGVQRFFGNDQHHVIDRHRPHPLRVVAGGQVFAGAVFQIAVIAGDIPFHQVARFLGARGITGTQLFDVEIALEKEVAVFICQVHESAGGAVFVTGALGGVRRRTEELRALATNRQQRIGEHAQIILCITVRQAIRETAKIIGADVDYTVRRSREFGTQRGCRRWGWIGVRAMVAGSQQAGGEGGHDEATH